jgi:two-component system, NarL family, sensor kinase
MGHNVRGISDGFLRQSPACNWVISAAGRFIRIDGGPAPIFGEAAASELAGRSLSESLTPDCAHTWAERVARSVSGETLLLRERHGSSTWYIVQFPLCGGSGTIGHAAGFALDVTPWSTAEQELRYTVLGALRAQEFERNTMSRFLHDSVGQNLSAVGLQLDLVRMDLEPVSPEACRHIQEIQQMLETMMQEVRECSYELNPAAVERAGLHPALDRLAGRMRVRFPGTLRLIFDPSLKIPAKYGTAMYQIAQEAVENAIQHAGCSLIEIAVKSTRTGPALEIRDNGRGFDPADVLGGRRGLGLLTMEHFAAEAGLDVTINSTREHGTTVRAAAAEGGE